MINATISADLVSSTSLSVEELTLLQSEIRHFLDELSKNSQGSQGGKNLHPRLRERTKFAQCWSCDWQCGKDAYACVCYVRAI